MTCHRCGAECGPEDKFCRICGAKFKVKRTRGSSDLPEPSFDAPENKKKADDYPESFSEPVSTLSGARKKRLFWIGAVVVFLILIAAAIWIFIPQFKQSFMSPSAFYVDSEARQSEALIDTLAGNLSDLTKLEKSEVSGVISFSAEGEQFDGETQDLLNRLSLLIDLQIEENGDLSLDCGTSFDNKLFCSVLARLLKDDFVLSFPDLTEAQVTQKLTDALYTALQGGDSVLETATGCTRAELKAWISSYLREVLRPALDEAEQSLDAVEEDGATLSTVTFTLSEKTVRKLITDLAKRLRRDETLVTVCESLSNYLGASDAFCAALKEEFHLTQEEFDRLPILSEADDAAKSLISDHALFSDVRFDFPLVFAYGTGKDAIRAELEARAERLIDHADDLKLEYPLTLTAYYQKTALVGRSLKLGDRILFECFCDTKDTAANFTLRFCDEDNQLFTLTADLAQSNSENTSYFEFSKQLYIEDEFGALTLSDSEKLWTLAVNLHPNTLVGGVHALTGEIKLNYGDEIFTLSNEKISDTDTLFTYEHRYLNDGESSKLKLRASLTYSARFQKDETRKDSLLSDFSKAAFDEVIGKLQEKLAGTPLYGRIFASETTGG